MALNFHVNGPALIRVGDQGTAGALADLGITVAGADVSITHFHDPVYTDAAGPRVPAEFQDLGQVARIALKLVNYDQTVLEDIMAQSAASWGVQPTAGALLFANSKGFRLVIASPIEGKPYRFPYCILGEDPVRTKLGTIRNEPELVVFATSGVQNATTMAGLALFDHVNG